MIDSSNLFCNSNTPKKISKMKFTKNVYIALKITVAFAWICIIKNELFNLEDNSVYENFSSCICVHNMKNTNLLFSENQILRFYNSFLKEFDKTDYEPGKNSCKLKESENNQK